MNYCIISLDDARKAYKERIRERVNLPEISVEAFDGRRDDPVAEVGRRGYRISSQQKHWGIPKRGELGCWISHMNAWELCVETGESLVVFEDDAIPALGFDSALDPFLADLPDNWGFMSLWVPPDQLQDYQYSVEYDWYDGAARILGTKWGESDYKFTETLAKVYQGYGMVATLYSPHGAKILLDAAAEMGLYSPVDCFLYLTAHTFRTPRLYGFAPAPTDAHLVGYDWPTTTIHDSGTI